jgi:hypothetical protein
MAEVTLASEASCRLRAMASDGWLFNAMLMH